MSVDTAEGPVDIIGLAAPSRDATRTKTETTHRFLEVCRLGLPVGWIVPDQPVQLRMVLGAREPAGAQLRPTEVASTEPIQAGVATPGQAGGAGRRPVVQGRDFPTTALRTAGTPAQ
ncbi:hypothetical protein ACFYN0_19930 [Streptomyces sp. NPDC006704]|uniref:hypothetical protein n=1 Tax=Streptomyces sp. NPDC006704 TaxID=3364760 RepID=UPI0036A555BF